MPPSCRFPPLREGNRARVRFPPLREGNRARVRFPLLAGGTLRRGSSIPLFFKLVLAIGIGLGAGDSAAEAWGWLTARAEVKQHNQQVSVVHHLVTVDIGKVLSHMSEVKQHE